MVLRRAENYTNCSCLGCCNVRRSKGQLGPEHTRQERLSELELREWLDMLRYFD